MNTPLIFPKPCREHGTGFCPINLLFDWLPDYLDPRDFMLMHGEREGEHAVRVGFKNRDTRKYVFARGPFHPDHWELAKGTA